MAPANENGENRTVLLLGEFGTAVSNPPVEVRIVGDLFTTDVYLESPLVQKSLTLTEQLPLMLFHLMMGQVYSLHKELMAI